MSVSVWGIVRAENVKGIMATYEGARTTYAFTETPTVKYVTEEGIQYAQLYVAGSAKPVASFQLAKGKQLLITYAEFEPSGIDGVAVDKVAVTMRNGKKYVRGGRLVIIKDGKQYDVDGKVL